MLKCVNGGIAQVPISAAVLLIMPSVAGEKD